MKVNINSKSIGTVVNVEGNATVYGAPGLAPSVPPVTPEIIPLQPVTARKGIFVSYAHEDAAWLGHFRTAFAPLVRAGIPLWWDGDIAPGQTWRTEIEAAISAARIAVVLVSPHTLASTFIQDVELPLLQSSALQNSLTLTWMLLRNCLVNRTPLAQIQALHDTSRPLNTLSEPELDHVLLSACESLERLHNRA